MNQRFGPELPAARIEADGAAGVQLGLGGEGPVLRSLGRDDEAAAIIRRALDLGITYFDTAPAYAGSEGYLGAAVGAERDRVFFASKTAERQAADARRDLHTTLRNLRTDWLDLWQLHDLRRLDQWCEVSGPGGAIEALQRAREAGDVRMVGITAHRNPDLLATILQTFRFDAVLMPVNVLEAQLPGFSTSVVAAARASGTAIVGMLVMVQGLLPSVGIPADWLLRFALGQSTDALVVGADSPEQVQQNVNSWSKGPLAPNEEEELMSLVEPFSRELAFYRDDGANRLRS